LLADSDHLSDHAGKDFRILQRIDERAAGLDFLAGPLDGALDHGVAGGTRGNVQTLENGDAAGDQRSQGAREAGDGDLPEKEADDGHFEQETINREPPLRSPIKQLQSYAHADKKNQTETAVDAAHEPAEADDDARRQGQLGSQSVEKGNEDGDDLPKKQGDDRASNAQEGDRINQRGIHRPLQLDVLLDVGREALENGVEDTARLSVLHHVVVERVEDPLMLPHGNGEGGAVFHGGAHRRQDFLESLVLLLPGQDLQALNEGQPGINHHRELTGEDGELLAVHAAAESRESEFLALFGKLGNVNLLATEERGQLALARSGALTGDGGPGAIDSSIRKDRHVTLLGSLPLPNGARETWPSFAVT